MGGVCPGKTGPRGTDRQRFDRLQKASKNMDNAARRRAFNDSQIKKLLLLGAGESGKSTLFKQMISIYGDGFSFDDRRNHIRVVYENVIVAIKTLCRALDDFKEIEEQFPLSEQAVQASDYILTISEYDIDHNIAKSIHCIWKEPAIQELWELRSQFQIIDSAEYFFNKIHEIGEDNYLPNEQDMIYSRIRTSGIVQTRFTIDNVKFHMFDVGGQRNERKKWIHCFEAVTMVIFVAAINEYDQTIYEDNATNRIVEAVNLFSDICNSRWFQDTNMILFLNKRDLFAQKIKKRPLKDFYPQYEGDPEDVEAGHLFFTEMFLDRRKNHSKIVYTHVTCATDRDNVNHVFNSVMHTVIQAKMKGGGIL